MLLFKQCHVCGLDMELETSIRGTLFVVSGTCRDGHGLAIPANGKGYGSWEFAVVRSYSTLWSNLHWRC